MINEQYKKPLIVKGNERGFYYSLPQLEVEGIGTVSRLPLSIRLVLESVLRNCDEERITTNHIKQLANWQPTGKREEEIPFVVGRVVLQDFTGVPLLTDLAAMRDATIAQKSQASLIEPMVPVDLVVDHSVQVDYYGSESAMQKNMEKEFARNRERYEFLKWGANAFQTFNVVPPGIGIVHQVNLENLAKGVLERDSVYYPDTLVGTDSHTTMINGVGVVGWGVGGIEAESAMLGQPVYILTPDVIGVHLQGELVSGVTATDLVLTITEMLRAAKVVGKFVEFFGEGARSLSVPDRATIANMAPEYGATMGFFPIDEKTIEYFRATGRSEEHLALVTAYYQAQQCWGIPLAGECDYTQQMELRLDQIVPSVAGPKRPQDRIALSALKKKFQSLYTQTIVDGGYGKSMEHLAQRYPTNQDGIDIGDGDILIAAITSCTNTSNPSVILAAGLLAKKAVERGLKPSPRVKTSLAPGSRVVSDYLHHAGLLPYLEQIGFNQVGYGCTTCIGNSGPLAPEYEKAIVDHQLVGVSVLSGNRNFEARVHQNIRANFLMSPPLVVAFALAGRIDIDMENEPLGTDQNNQPVYLRDIWPSSDEIEAVMPYAIDPQHYRQRYEEGYADKITLWRDIPSGSGHCYQWQEASTYIRKPPFFNLQDNGGEICSARALALLGDSVTTDHISPAGAIKPDSPAGLYLQDNGVDVGDYNTYGSRRGNHEIMLRGTFANVRIHNLMVPGSEGGVTTHIPSNETLSIYDAAMRYQKEATPLLVFAGEEYGTGSSRDWAAKGTRLLGVKAVIASSFERIHRSNLIGMGVLPCQFVDDVSVQSLALTGDESFDIVGLTETITPHERVTLRIHRPNSLVEEVPLLVRVDTPIESQYYACNGILPFVLSQLVH